MFPRSDGCASMGKGARAAPSAPSCGVPVAGTGRPCGVSGRGPCSTEAKARRPRRFSGAGSAELVARAAAGNSPEVQRIADRIFRVEGVGWRGSFIIGPLFLR